MTGSYLPARLERLALSQWLLFHSRQLALAGIPPAVAQARVRAGELFRIHHGVYALVPAAQLTWQGRCLAAVFAAGPNGVLSHGHALALHGVIAVPSGAVDVTVPTRGTRRRKGIRFHRSRTLGRHNLTAVQGIRATTVGRALFDYATQVPERRLIKAIDEAHARDLLDVAQIQHELTTYPNAPQHAELRRVLATHVAASTLTDSELEELALPLLEQAAGTPPLCQHHIDPYDGGPLIRVDFAFEPERVAVQADGYRWHRIRGKFERDRADDARLLAAGWLVLRCTERQLRSEPHIVQARLRAVLQQRRAGARRSPT